MTKTKRHPNSKFLRAKAAYWASRATDADTSGDVESGVWFRVRLNQIHSQIALLRQAGWAA